MILGVGLLFVLPVILIMYTLFSLTKKGDEMAEFVKSKVNRFTLAIVIISLVTQVIGNFWQGPYEATNPFTFLVTITLFYCGSLMYYKKKIVG